MLTVTPLGGLCNRLFALHSAIHLAQDIDQPLRIIWRVTEDFGAPLEALFHLPPEIAHLITIEKRHPTFRQRLRDEVIRYTSRPMLRKGPDGYTIKHMAEAGHDFTVLGQRRHSSLQGFSIFHAAEKPFYQFRPVDHLAARYAEIIPDPANTIGVHIRRTDNEMAIARSPTSLFVAAIEDALAQAPQTRIFLATDDPAEEADLMARFPGAIFTAPKRSLDRSQHDAIEDAVIDLYALARCKGVIGSMDSTFSLTAGKIGGFDTRIIDSGAE